MAVEHFARGESATPTIATTLVPRATKSLAMSTHSRVPPLCESSTTVSSRPRMPPEDPRWYESAQARQVHRTPPPPLLAHAALHQQTEIAMHPLRRVHVVRADAHGCERRCHAASHDTRLSKTADEHAPLRFGQQTKGGGGRWGADACCQLTEYEEQCERLREHARLAMQRR